MLSIPAAIIVTGMLVAANAALLGSFLVVRGQALVTDAISHGILPGIAVTIAVHGSLRGPGQLLAAATSGIVTVLIIDWLTANKLRRDSATGLVFPAFFALGILILSLFAGHVRFSLDSVLLGEIGFVWVFERTVFGVTLPSAVWALFGMLIINSLFLLGWYRPLVSASFDAQFALLTGQRPRVVVLALLVLTSITAVAAFEAVGVVLFMAFAIVPALAGQLLFRRLVPVVVFAVLAAGSAAAIGYPLAVWLEASIAPVMALATGIPLVVALGVRMVATWRGKSRPFRG